MDIQIFNQNGWEIRTIEKNGEIWFVAKDVCEALGFKNSRDAISNHLEENEKDDVALTDTIGRLQQTKVVNESGMYALIFKSTKKDAVQFRVWVTSEVLPQIRKTGSYNMRVEKVKLPDKIQAQMIGIEFTQKLLRISDVSVLELMHNVYESNNLPTTGLIDYVPSKGILVDGTTLLKRLEADISMIAFNKLLLADGYLEQKERTKSNGKIKKFYALTDKGLNFGENQVSKYSKLETQPHYYENSFSELFDSIIKGDK